MISLSKLMEKACNKCMNAHSEESCLHTFEMDATWNSRSKTLFIRLSHHENLHQVMAFCRRLLFNYNNEQFLQFSQNEMQ